MPTSPSDKITEMDIERPKLYNKIKNKTVGIFGAISTGKSTTGRLELVRIAKHNENTACFLIDPLNIPASIESLDESLFLVEDKFPHNLRQKYEQIILSYTKRSDKLTKEDIEYNKKQLVYLQRELRDGIPSDNVFIFIDNAYYFEENDETTIKTTLEKLLKTVEKLREGNKYDSITLLVSAQRLTKQDTYNWDGKLLHTHYDYALNNTIKPSIENYLNKNTTDPRVVFVNSFNEEESFYELERTEDEDNLVSESLV